MSHCRDQAAAERGFELQNAHWLWLSLFVILADQATKQLVADHFVLYESIPLLPWLNLTLVHNTGAAFSILRGSTPWLFVGLGVAVVFAILVWMRRHPHDHRLQAAAFSLVVGGALGNVIDRVIRGFVVDFIDIHVDAWHYPAFNLADSAICIGAVLIVVELFMSKRRG